MRYATEEE